MFEFRVKWETCMFLSSCFFPFEAPSNVCCVFILEYILGTVHKAKGLEFDTVHVLDDFVKVPCARHNLPQLPHFRVGKRPPGSVRCCCSEW